MLGVERWALRKSAPKMASFLPPMTANVLPLVLEFNYEQSSTSFGRAIPWPRSTFFRSSHANNTNRCTAKSALPPETNGLDN